MKLLKSAAVGNSDVACGWSWEKLPFTFLAYVSTVIGVVWARSEGAFAMLSMS